MKRLTFLCLCTFAMAGAWAQSADLPDRPIKLYVGFPPGGTTDAAARVISTRLGDLWRRAVVVENRPGASGMLAASAVAKAAPDGTSLLVAPQTTMALAPALYKNVPFDTVRDFTPVTMMGAIPQVLVVNASQPFKTVAELVAFAKAHPGDLTYGSGGSGTSPHIAGALMAHLSGIRMTHVPYKGESLAVNDVLGGQTAAIFSNISVIQPFIKAGRVRALAVTSPVRSPLLPDVPTLAESGLAGFDSSTWQGVFGPAGLPRPLADRMAADIRRVLQEPEVAASLAGQGFVTIASTPAEFRRQLDAELHKWARVVKETGATVD